ncbi:heavy-metal-associated domain-containing protein [Mediterraneibacter glycyrrhizinilyticus]|nr:heavy metal-associated domain-containing protein [Mediterraneibacter glycyrrhizinilyticus]MBM6852882.1 heavy-metal-associated domain-containing protein [Mediterraneibacter glycyrrhizinilyticus]
MANVIAAVILVILIGSAAAYIAREKKRGVKCIGCPAGGNCPNSRTPKKKLAGPVIGRKTMKISGMHCAHCASDVTAALNQIDGVRAEVNFSKGRAKITYDKEVGDDMLKNTVEKMGYQVISISRNT